MKGVTAETHKRSAASTCRSSCPWGTQQTEERARTPKETASVTHQVVNAKRESLARLSAYASLLTCRPLEGESWHFLQCPNMNDTPLHTTHC